jgi:lipopolysaccharide export LptBFGC system permease protein LptF
MFHRHRQATGEQRFKPTRGRPLRLADMIPVSFGVRRPVSLGHLAGLSADIFKITLIVLVTIEALFLSDVIVSRVLPELLSLGAGIGSIALVVLYSVPNGLFIALPTALLVGVYIVVLRRRENQEFKIFAGFGYGPRTLSLTAVTVGLTGAVLSLALSGFVEPVSRYLLVTTLEGVAHQAIRDGDLASGRFYQVGDTTIFAASGHLKTVAGDVFMHQKRSDDLGRVIVASRLFNPQVGEQNQFGLLLNDVNVYEFSDRAGGRKAKKAEPGCVNCDQRDKLPPLKYMYVDKFYMDLPKVSAEVTRSWRHPRESNFIDLFSVAEWDPRHVEVFGERLLRSVLCLLTPLLALVAVALTTKATLLFALPAASAGVLFLSFFASNNIGVISQYGLGATLAILLGGAIAMAGGLVVLVRKLNGRFIGSIGVSV